ncbi:RNA polymerase sigma-70 factor (ECF subfamily) [Pseudobacter ginsenosidimutans]|uniref:RNA polymerase sigma-70 factor (ECF subfamily) n=1 Tax=Pseudobacter ginsenosidimutans TaxID=661488 RepID=A0A4Q7MYH1_9BACT|nr:RNA polymerase sigma-70 factor [Pseudobacter ginsenosidimutans]RZS74267.1 RNA polymerase sigma-70 factor (ECF subfamily) [Pseudobacter ginsenosidimutans]
MPTEPSYVDKELFFRIAEGEEQAFTQFFIQWATPLTHYANKILRNDQAARDVMQEVFIKVWLYRDKLPQVEQPAAWLKKVVTNQCLLILDKNAAQDKRLAALRLAQPSQQEDPLPAIDFREIRQTLNKVIEQLPQQRRTIYRMNREEGKTTKEIADDLSLSHGYVRNALSAALDTIRQELNLRLDLPIFLLLLLF